MIKIQEYLEHEKELYIALIAFLDCNENDKENFSEIINIIEKQNFGQSRYETREILLLLAKIVKNHRRNNNFFNKIEHIFLHLGEKIKQTFSNSEIFKIFQSNKRILLLLFQNKLIVPDKTITNMIILLEYQFYFYTEICSFITEEEKRSIEGQMLEIDENVFINFEEKRLEGENDSYVCQLIRKDSVENFCSFINQTNLSISSEIKPSIFETNSFLIKNKNSTLVEYAAFFGSVQIFRYLLNNYVELKPSIWLYSVHSNNAELIHLLEEYHIEPAYKNYEKCFKEAINCHHNQIASYIKDKYLEKNEEKTINSHCFHYHNFHFIPSKFEVKLVPYLFEFDYIPIVEIALKAWDITSTNQIIQTSIF